MNSCFIEFINIFFRWSGAKTNGIFFVLISWFLSLVEHLFGAKSVILTFYIILRPNLGNVFIESFKNLLLTTENISPEEDYNQNTYISSIFESNWNTVELGITFFLSEPFWFIKSRMFLFWRFLRPSSTVLWKIKQNVS